MRVNSGVHMITWQDFCGIGNLVVLKMSMGDLLMGFDDGIIVYYRGLWCDSYFYPLNELCPGAYYLKIKPYKGVALFLDIPGVLPIIMNKKTFEKEFITP